MSSDKYEITIDLLNCRKNELQDRKDDIVCNQLSNCQLELAEVTKQITELDEAIAILRKY
jgi:hypothetical protein